MLLNVVFKHGGAESVAAQPLAAQALTVQQPILSPLVICLEIGTFCPRDAPLPSLIDARTCCVLIPFCLLKRLARIVALAPLFEAAITFQPTVPPGGRVRCSL